VAELHVESGWVPPDTKVDEFEFAIRTVLEPIFEKPLSEISFGHVLLNLFNTARRFNMQVQPQLVLLQRPCSMWKGWVASSIPSWICGRPPSPIWKLDARAGRPQGGVECHQGEGAVLGGELPELPELVYETLRQARHQQHHFDQMFADFRRHSRRQGARYLLGVGASLLLAGVFLLTQKQHIEWGQISLAGAGLCWLLGWLRTRSH
jgi:ubiquinone biosynthesis protein